MTRDKSLLMKANAVVQGLGMGELACHRLALAARAFSSAKSHMEEYVASQDLMRAALEFSRCIDEKLMERP